jgi:hypothetical protein
MDGAARYRGGVVRDEAGKKEVGGRHASEFRDVLPITVLRESEKTGAIRCTSRFS